MNENVRQMIDKGDFDSAACQRIDSKIIFYEMRLKKSRYSIEDVMGIRNQIEAGLRKGYDELSLNEIGINLDLGCDFSIDYVSPLEKDLEDVETNGDNGNGKRSRYLHGEEAEKIRGDILDIVYSSGVKMDSAGIFKAMHQKGHEIKRHQLRHQLKKLIDSNDIGLQRGGACDFYFKPGEGECQEQED